MGQDTISETINKLLIIQERDVRIMRLQREIDQIPQKRGEIEDEVNKIREAVKKAKDEFKVQQSEVKKFELEIESLRQKVAKLREQQFQIKSNEEFKVLNNEITHLNDEIKKMEDREITFMELAEGAQQRELKAQEDLKAKENTVKDRLRVLDERKAGLEAEVKQLEANRDNNAKDVASEFLAIYNRIIKNKQDQALVAVENNACAGCHMLLPAHIACDLRKRSGLITCSFCGRILYLPADRQNLVH